MLPLLVLLLGVFFFKTGEEGRERREVGRRGASVRVFQYFRRQLQSSAAVVGERSTEKVSLPRTAERPPPPSSELS